ncbi:MAG: metallophosphoesterase family protein [Planctomycetota bacterium]|jgi:predicted phosphodiesterase
MLDTQLAVISDVHGNRWALEAVLADIQCRGIRERVNLGDSLYGPLDPAGTAQILSPLDLPTVRGNEDRIIIEPSHELECSPTLRYVRESLSAEHLEWLKGLKMTLDVYGEFHMCHGSDDRDDEYLLQEVTEAGVSLRKTETLMAKLGRLEEPVLLCGHDHVPRTVHLPDGRLIVDPGSVGLPAYTDELPFPHAMGNGTPHARYSVMSREESRWRVENVEVPYDWQSAAATAQNNGRPDWAEWLRTGRADVI